MILSRTSDHTYRKNRSRLLRSKYLVCWLCGDEIDKTLKYPHPRSFSADHVRPVALGGRNSGTLKPAHLFCNQSRGADRSVSSSARIEKHVMEW